MQPTYSVAKDVDIPMRDGVRLRGDLWLPAGQAPTAAIVFRTPYDKNALNFDGLKPQHCVEAGFAALVQDTRGRFASAGNWKPVMWGQEGVDTFDTVEWVADQAWCTGAVGLCGPSYLGIVQLVGALLKPPHLKAIAPSMASTLKFERAETGGCLRMDHVLSWIAFMAVEWLQKQYAKGTPPSSEHAALIAGYAQNPRTIMDHRPVREIPLFAIPGFPVSFDQLIADLSAVEDIDAAAIDIPTLHVGGWYDVFARSTVGMFTEQTRAGRNAHLLMGCWTHSGNLPQYHGQVNFGIAASAIASRIKDLHLDFFRRYLRGEDSKMPRVRYFLMGANQWRESEAWPPAGTAARRYYLSENGLDNEQPAQDGVDSYLYDPADPTPTVGGRVLYLSRLVMGPLDQRPLDHRGDILRYSSAPLSNMIDLAGPAAVELYVSSSAVDTDFVVKLLDVDGAGTALPVAEGVLRMRWRKGFDRERPLAPDEVEPVRIELGDTAWRVERGHRLRVQIQSANYPHLDPNMNTGHALGVDAHGVTATNCVFYGPAQPSFLELTVLEGK